jgi:hypothetical protein
MAIYVDLDGTLAYYDGWKGPEVIGKPIPTMLERVRKWVSEGKVVKIFTARATNPDQIPMVQKWLDDLELEMLEITCTKGTDGEEFWDDRAVTVEKNTGKVLTISGNVAEKLLGTIRSIEQC